MRLGLMIMSKPTRSLNEPGCALSCFSEAFAWCSSLISFFILVVPSSELRPSWLSSSAILLMLFLLPELSLLTSVAPDVYPFFAYYGSTFIFILGLWIYTFGERVAPDDWESVFGSLTFGAKLVVLSVLKESIRLATFSNLSISLCSCASRYFCRRMTL